MRINRYFKFRRLDQDKIIVDFIYRRCPEVITRQTGPQTFDLYSHKIL